MKRLIIATFFTGIIFFLSELFVLRSAYQAKDCECSIDVGICACSSTHMMTVEQALLAYLNGHIGTGLFLVSGLAGILLGFVYIRRRSKAALIFSAILSGAFISLVLLQSLTSYMQVLD